MSISIYFQLFVVSYKMNNLTPSYGTNYLSQTSKFTEEEEELYRTCVRITPQGFLTLHI